MAATLRMARDWLHDEAAVLTAEVRTARAGDRGLQVAAMAAGFVALAYGFADVWTVLGGRFSQPASIVILLLAALGGIALASLFGRVSLLRATILLLGVYVAAALAGQALVDVSYDGQDYHFTAMWAFVNGWNPYHGSFSDFVAPGSDEEMWAWHFPKAHWIFGALQVAAGLTYESAKTETVLLAVATFGAIQGAARRLGASLPASVAAAALAALNPIVLQELFSRMNDGMMAGFVALFLVFGVLAVVSGERRAMLVALAVLAVALNTKQSAILILGMLCAWLCLLTLLRSGWRPAVGRGALLLAAAIVALFVIGADPYLRNTIKNGNPVYPMRGAPQIVIDDEFRPPALLHHSDPVRLAMSLAGETSYTGPVYKPPFAIRAGELRLAGDPEVFLGGFGPLFSGALLLGLACALYVAAKRPPLAGTPAIVALSGLAILLSSFAMPESWAVRYVPQLWLAPLLFAGAAATWPRGRWLAALCGLAMLADAGVVAASVAVRQGGASVRIADQLRRLAGSGGILSADVGASPARLALFQQRGVAVRLRAGPNPRCRDLEPLPLAYEYEDDKSRSATICRLAAR